MNDNFDENYNNITNNEETPLIQSQKNNDDGGAVILDTIVDSINYIIKRDSEVALYKQKTPTSPWKFDATVHSPMLSSPRGSVTIPDLAKRRQNQIDKYKLEKQLRKQERKKRDELKLKNETMKFMDEGAGGETEFEIEVDLETEDDQWERKRKAKLQKVIQTSTSASSFASSSGFSSIGGYSPTADIINDLKLEFSKTKTPTSVSIVYGIINTVIVLPVLMSFGSIIYNDDFFRPYMPVLVRITVISGIVHQLSFSTFSTLPFSVGQVQDAGLIFLSSIASDIVRYCKEDGRDDEEILATTLIGLSLFTATLGFSLIVIGKLKLASYVQLLPTPVVGGYLAFIGFFCGQGGLSLMSNIQVSGVMEWYEFVHEKAIIMLSPGLIGGIGIYVGMRTIKHMAVLPCAVALIIISFYVSLGATGTSLESAKEFGWLNQADAPPVWYHTWDYMKFDKVVWSALPGQTLTVLSMIVVVALSSSLDIAAIDLEVPKPLEYNYELRMIGLSNILSGLTGGYTGSYIFSQTIFSLRAGIRSSLMGYVIAVCEAITVVIPISILSYVPNFVFGSLLIMICVDLMVEWLWDVRKKLSQAEYCIALSTFVLIQMSSVEYGIIIGSFLHYVLKKLGFDMGTPNEDKESIDERLNDIDDQYESELVTNNDSVIKDPNIFSGGTYHSSPIMV